MPESPSKLSLPFGECSPPPAAAGVTTAPARREIPATAGRSVQRFWLCLYLYRLPLEIFAAPADAPRAVLDGDRQPPCLLLCNPAAAGLGVHPGLALNAALALAPQLQLNQRERRLEHQALESLAAWAVRFTPAVSIDPCNALLLEIGASLKLFGGHDKLRAAAIAGARAAGHCVRTACAPTARAALWLARAGREATVTDISRLPGLLAQLPLDCLGWPDHVRKILRQMGVRRLGECARLPRDGLARRIGARQLRELDEGYGRHPEVRESHYPPGQFRDALELPAETSGSALVLEALQVLLQRLRPHLQRRQAGAQILWVSLRHRASPDTLLRIGLLRPSADVSHLYELAHIHFSATHIHAPVVSVALEADAADPRAMPAGDLLGAGADESERLAGLLERLRIRLGFHAVHGVRTGSEHRPERAWHAVADLEGTPSPGTQTTAPGQRPLWLLETPVLLDSHSGRPFFQGWLAYETGPERIETGWWDGQDIRRDYYVMRNPRGARLWVFRDRRAGGWYLHGMFG